MRIKKATTRLFALFLALLILALPASADMLFTRQSSWSDPVALGIVVGDGAPYSPLQSNMGGNSGNGIFPFLDAKGNLRIALSFYTGTGSVAGDTLDIYDPGARGNWARPANWDTPVKESLPSVKNIRAVSTIGSYMYVTGYDTQTISRITTTGDSYVESKVWTHPTPANRHGEGLVTYGGYVYAIFTNANSPMDEREASYSPNEIWKFDKDLNFVASADMTGRNLDGQRVGACVRYGKYLYVSSFGGSQITDGIWDAENHKWKLDEDGNRIYYRDASCLEMVDLETMEIKSLTTAKEQHEKNKAFKYNFLAMAVYGDSVYVQVNSWEPYNDRNGYHVLIYKTTADELRKGNIGEVCADWIGHANQENGGGIQMGLVVDPETNYLWVGTGSSMRRFDGTTWHEWTRNDLKGLFSAMAPISATYGSGTGALISSVVPVASSDVSVSGAVIASASTGLDAPADLSQAVADGNYATAVESGDQFGNMTLLHTMKLSLTHGDDAGKVTVVVDPFAYTPASGKQLYALVRRKTGGGGSGKYDLFPATLEGGILTFEISPVGDYFSENTIVIAETSAVETSDPETPWSGNGASTGGCDAGFAALALLALVPLGMRRKK